MLILCSIFLTVDLLNVVFLVIKITCFTRAYSILISIVIVPQFEMICCVDSSIYWVTRLYQLHEWHELYMDVPQSPIYMPQIHEVR